MIPSLAVVCAGLLLITPMATFAAEARVGCSDASPMAVFAKNSVEAAMAGDASGAGYRVTLRVAERNETSGLIPEGFRIVVGPQSIDVIGADEAGLLYGGLEVAEVIRTLGVNALKDDVQNPYMQMRGTKFNCPLDARTPSYSDVCDAAQLNIPEMWNFSFWEDYIDHLARHRYNFVSLWSLHPFPSLVRVPKYPEVALDDVWRSKVQWKEDYPLVGVGFVTDEILADVEVVRTMTMDEKIAFWREVMAYGKSRNVDFHIVTWNTFTYGTFGKYGITDSVDNDTTIDYFRRSVAALFRTYPDLAGVGLTTGENMHGADFQKKEDWAMATYGQGVLDAAKEHPGRKITFIHRQHQANAPDVAKTFQPLVDHPDIDFIFSFKYAKAHVYSATEQPYHDDFVKSLDAIKTIWTLRNDSVYHFRWGAPDYVREFVRNIPCEVSQGYYYGSDGYVWGREFLERNAVEPRTLDVDKHWLKWLLWGRLGYDPSLENVRIQAILAERFGLTEREAASLFEAWQNASMVYPITTGFHWGPVDFVWYIEGCQSRPGPAENKTGFHDVNRFITLPPHPKRDYQSIPDFVENGPVDGKLSPFQVADALESRASQALAELKSVPAEKGPELSRTRTDILTISTLGFYYAEKIRGATCLAIHRDRGDEAAQSKAVEHLTAAAHHWHEYASLVLKHYKNPLWTNRVGYVDFKRNYRYVLDDIRIAGGDPDALGLPPAVEQEGEPVKRGR